MLQAMIDYEYTIYITSGYAFKSCWSPSWPFSISVSDHYSTHRGLEVAQYKKGNLKLTQYDSVKLCSSALVFTMVPPLCP